MGIALCLFRSKVMELKYLITTLTLFSLSSTKYFFVETGSSHYDEVINGEEAIREAEVANDYDDYFNGAVPPTHAGSFSGQGSATAKTVTLHPTASPEDGYCEALKPTHCRALTGQCCRVQAIVDPTNLICPSRC